MARALRAATAEASGVLQARALARIGGSSELPLVGVKPTEEKDDHERQEHGHAEQDLPRDTKDGVESSRHHIVVDQV
jgi:hypothetical protein